MRYTNSMAQAKAWECITVIQGATPKSYTLVSQHKGPCTSVGVCHTNSRARGHSLELHLPKCKMTTPKQGNPLPQLHGLRQCMPI